MRWQNVCPLFCMALSAASQAQVDYPSAIWRAANSGNFSVANRPTDLPIQYVVIHITEGSYSGAISWFQNAASNVSAHYVLRSSDGEVTQMVRHKDIGYHAGVWWYNQRSVGIEHEATSSSSSWYTNALYNSSAALTRWITTQHGIPRNRTYIIGHRETGAATSCPGPFWDWTYYMSLVNQGANLISSNIPDYMSPGTPVDVSVIFQNTSDFTWNATPGNDYVQLRTQSPAGRNSPFFTSGNWVSASIVKPVSSNVANGSNAAFSFRLTPPTTSGTYSESYQMYRQSTGYFGPIVTATIGVGTLTRDIDNTSAGFALKGTWSTGTSATDKFGTDYRFIASAPKTAASAEWALNAPVAGLYEVYGWWPQGTNRSGAVTYELEGSRERVYKVVNQQAGGGQWNLLGRVRLKPGGGFARVLGLSSSSGVVMADAVRLVGPL